MSSYRGRGAVLLGDRPHGPPAHGPEIHLNDAPPYLSSPVKGAVEQQLAINDAELQAGVCGGGGGGVRIWGGGEVRGEGGGKLGNTGHTVHMGDGP